MSQDDRSLDCSRYGAHVGPHCALIIRTPLTRDVTMHWRRDRGSGSA